jgi:hypothetical protein
MNDNSYQPTTFKFDFLFSKPVWMYDDNIASLFREMNMGVGAYRIETGLTADILALPEPNFTRLQPYVERIFTQTHLRLMLDTETQDDTGDKLRMDVIIHDDRQMLKRLLDLTHSISTLTDSEIIPLALAAKKGFLEMDHTIRKMLISASEAKILGKERLRTLGGKLNLDLGVHGIEGGESIVYFIAPQAM